MDSEKLMHFFEIKKDRLPVYSRDNFCFYYLLITITFRRYCCAKCMFLTSLILLIISRFFLCLTSHRLTRNPRYVFL